MRELHSWIDVVDAGYLPRGLKTKLANEVKAQRRRDSIGPVTPEYGRELLGPDLWDDLEDRFEDAAVRDNPAGLLDWLFTRVMASKRKYMQFGFSVARGPQGLRGLAVKPRVVVGTIHSAKGGEADHVHLFPDLSRPAFQGWVREGSDQHDAIVRQFYVGMTRARHTLTLHPQSGPQAVNLNPR